MAITSFEAHVRHQPRAAIVDLQGEINIFAERTLTSAFDEAISQQPELILLNFRQVEYMNSTGIALIVGLLKRARQLNYPLLACGLSDHYLEIFQISRLTDYIPVFPDEASALVSIIKGEEKDATGKSYHERAPGQPSDQHY